ncbi:MAG: GGDEF domain-containing protein [Oscillospiraceae bacterium]|nr:GGDEF domain-containing protein [Oscillospiraceae bacterium]
MKEKLNGEITVTENLYMKSADYKFLEYTGLDMNSSIEAAVYPDDLPILTNMRQKLEGGSYYAVLRLRGADGSYHPFLSKIKAVASKKWDYILVCISFADLDFLIENDNIRRDEQIITDSYFDVLGDILIEYDRRSDKLEVYYVNDSRRRVVVSGKLNECKECIKPKILPEYMGEYNGLFDNIKASSESFCAEVKTEGVEELNGAICEIRCKSVGEKVVGCVKLEHTEKVKNINIDIVNDKDAFLDMLNKRAIVEQAERMMSRGLKHIYFILLDLDNFKNVNDTYGHIAGDEVLTTVTKIINDKLAERGIVGRMGGDEILIITETINGQTELRNLLRNIRTAIEWTFKTDPRELNVTCSMGVCEFPKYGKTFESIYRYCDKMLYLAKEKGKNRYIIYTPELHERYVNADAEQQENVSAKDLVNDKVGIMQRLVDNYLTKHSYNNEKIFSEIGEAYGLNEILMIYDDFTVAFQWNPSGVFSDISKIVHFKPQDDFWELFDKDNLLVLDHLYKLDGKCPDVEKCLVKKDVDAAVFYRLCHNNKFTGYVMFARSTTRQSWSDYEVMALSTAAKVFDVSMHDL